MNRAMMVSGFGQYHTDEPGKEHRRPYVPIDLDGIRQLVDAPQKVLKENARWVIPSTLQRRDFGLQERQGDFWMLWQDLDYEPEKDPFTPLPLDQVANVLDGNILNGCQFEAYTSSSASENRQKARILVPLDQPLSGADWVVCQEVFIEKLAENEITGDVAAKRTAQLCYLPNRGEFYRTLSNREGGVFDPLKVWADEVAVKRKEIAEQAAEVDRRRKAAEERKAALRASDTMRVSVIDAFNDAFAVEDILIQAGYDERGNTFRHPNSESGSFSASVKDGRVHSLSSSDPLYTNGGGVGAHDAFSAFTVLFHQGAQKRAMKDAGDNWLTINGESWNKVRQREHQLERAKVQTTDFISDLDEDAKHHPLTALVCLEPINQEELRKARLTPRCVLPELLYADVRTRISAGGTGKTTVALFEAVTLALGNELWGRAPKHPCRTVIVTREDSREILVARMREIMDAMLLDEREVAQVLANLLIVDVSGVSFRLSSVAEDVVIPNAQNLNWLVANLKEWKPDWIIFDPLVSFGVGESRVNDAEQGLIEAFRVLRNHLDCCVEGIHHSGKANARDKSTDQYAGRGGSALSDGCRMVVVMQPLEPDEWLRATGMRLGDGESGIVMALPKLSFAGKQEPIHIRRDGYRFSRVRPIHRSPEQEDAAIENQVCQFITYEFSQGRRYTNQDLEGSSKKMNLSRAQIRTAITALKVSGRIIYHEVRGKSGSHYEPVTLAEGPGDTQENEVCNGDN